MLYPLLVVATLLTPLPQAVPQEATPQRPEGRVLVKIDDTRLSDADRARVAKILAGDVPHDDWPTVQAQLGDTWERLVDRYYDVFRATVNPVEYAVLLPKTTAALVQLIREANPGVSEQFLDVAEIRIPPVPVRTKSGYLGHTIRLYDPLNVEYAQRSETNEWTFAEGMQPARELNEIRTSKATFVEVSPHAAAALKTIAPEQRAVLYAQVRLHQAAACALADPRIDQSPYFAAAKARVAGNLSSAVTAAAARHLALLDFDFHAGHGSRVRSAAEWLLTKFDAQALIAFIRNFEMSKAVKKDDLTAAISDYDEWNTAQHQDDSFEFAEAGLWLLRKTSVQPSNTVYVMPSLAVAAPLWKHINAGDWLSLSWQVDAVQSVQPAGLRDQLSHGKTFVTVSAGNDRGEVRSDLFPQSGASLFPQFVNVTYGDPDGHPRGSVTSTLGGGKVDLLGIGCGIGFQALKTSDADSSFAAPLVAASAWLRSLVDKNTTPDNIRTALDEAALLTAPVVPRASITGGVFDPARLLFPMVMHYLDPARRQLTALSDATLNAGTCGTYRPFNDSRGFQDFIVYQQEGQYYLLRRHRVSDFPGIRVEDPCELSTLTFTGQTANGPVVVNSPADFVGRIGHLTF